ncbi:hypothetical protein C3L33_09914, partial [Rhododendron williamsianum]
MASTLLKINLLQTIHTSDHSFQLQLTRTPFLSLQFPAQNHHLPHAHLSFFPSRTPLHRTKPLSLSIQSSLSSPTTPPTTKDEAILQARTCLSAALEKPLNNTFLAVKVLKKLSQPRFQVEIPVIDDSPYSLSKLALQVFGEIPIRRKGPPVKILIIWPNPTLTEAAIKAFKGSQLAVMKRVTDSLYPKPVVIFNPGWGFEEESSFGVLSNRKGVVFKCDKDGVSSGEKWFIFVEEEGGEMKAVSSSKLGHRLGKLRMSCTM